MCRWICQFFLTWEAKPSVASKCWSPAKLHKKKAPKTGRENGTRGQDQHVSNQTVWKWWATKRWWSWMKLLAEFSRSKVSWKCQKLSWKVSSEMMRHAPCAWKLIWKNPKITLVLHLFKSSSENGNSERQNQRVESLQNWKGFLRKVQARRARALTPQPYSPAHPKTKLHPSCNGGQNKRII
jgi:hypothetical protein